MNAGTRQISYCLLTSSLLATPTLIFLWTANHNYLANQADLGHDSSILIPYPWLSLATILFGTAVGLSSTSRPVRLILWFYYLIGPTYFLYRVLGKLYWEIDRKGLSDLADNTIFLGLICALVGLLFVIWKRDFPLQGFAKVLALFGPLFLLSEVYSFVSKAESTETGTQLMTKLGYSEDAHTDTNLPNIYHIILDGFQTEMFEYTYPHRKRQDELNGMWYFPENITNYGRTRFSVPSVFLGRIYDGESSQLSFFQAQFDSQESFLYALRQASYKTFGFHVFPKVKGAEETLFDYTIRHDEYISLNSSADPEVFRQLWLVSNFPELLYRLFLSESQVRAIRNQQVLPPSLQAKSYRAFEKILEVEPELPARGRYTFMHLLIPHPPSTLDKSCSQQQPTVSETDAYLPHILCADKIIRDLVNRLKELDRYNQSMIVIHGDHGFYAGLRGGKLVSLDRGIAVSPEIVDGHTAEFARTRSRALLIIKPPGTGENETGMVVSPFRSMLTDVAPTILQAVGIAPVGSNKYPSLLKMELGDVKRERHYHFYDFVTTPDGVRQTASEMFRWRIEGEKAIPEGSIHFSDNLSN